MLGLKLNHVSKRGHCWLQSTRSHGFHSRTLFTWILIISPPSCHHSDVIMSVIASQITSVSIVCSGADQRKHQSSASLAFARGIHRWPVDSPHKEPVTRKMFPFDGVIMGYSCLKVAPKPGQNHLRGPQISNRDDSWCMQARDLFLYLPRLIVFNVTPLSKHTDIVFKTGHGYTLYITATNVL